MKTFIVLLLIALFCQASFLPINVSVLLLISRSLTTPGKDNLYLGFFSGLLFGLLTSNPLGFYAICFIIIVQIVLLIRKSPLSGHFLVVIPLTLISVYGLAMAEQIFLNTSFTFSTILIETILSLPVYLFVRFWEDRFDFHASRRTKLKI